MKIVKDKHLGLRIDKASLKKLHFISNFEGRSCNGQLLYLVRECIEKFEEKHGTIEID